MDADPRSQGSQQLGRRPLSTRVVTYAGYPDEIPMCYRCEATALTDELKLWINDRGYDPRIERLGLTVSRSYRDPSG